jgi:hypothetical protein
VTDVTDVTSELDEAAHVRPHANVYARAFGAELVLLDFARGEYFGLDEVGALVWSRIEAGDALGAIADAVTAQFDVAREIALRDIVTLVHELRSSLLVDVT